MNTNENKINLKNSLQKSLSLPDAKIKGFGKSSVDLSNNTLILKSIESGYNVKKSVSDIDYLIYSKGNFFFDDTIYMGIGGQQFEVTCKNDEISLRNLYDNLVKIKAENNKSEPMITQEEQNNITEAEQGIDENKTVVSTSEEIRNLYNLMKEGIITEEEFTEFKKELLKPK